MSSEGFSEDQKRFHFPLIKKSLIDALLIIDEKLKGSGVSWAVGGDLGEVMRSVEVEADSVEIITNKEGVYKIFLATKDYYRSEVKFSEERLSRDARINGKDYPIYFRSHNFEFEVASHRVKVFGDLQVKVNDWEWGDVLEFDPEYVNVLGEKIAVMPLSLRNQFYESFGWPDRLKKVRAALFSLD